MKFSTKKIAVAMLSAVICLTACSCGSKSSTEDSKSLTDALDAKNPTTISVWNYYNGAQLDAFNKLVEEFNASTGKKEGIVVVSTSQGDIDTLANALLDSADGKAGAQKLPTLASVYAETAYIIDQSNKLASFDDYFTKEDLAKYIPSFIEEGRFNKNNDLMLFPISKSTEVFTANQTDWDKFAEATGVKLEDVNTQEDLVAAAKKYYEWTDSLTPKVKDDGKSLYGRDSVANYIYVGSYQLGHELFVVKDGKMTLDMDKATFKTLWDNYYIPFINGYFGQYAKFRSEDAKTGKILSLSSSTSSIGYLPDEVISEDDKSHPITMIAEKNLPFKDAKNNASVQQGASFCMLKSTKAEQQGAVEFLKWFTNEDRNIDFSVTSGYSPVTVNANKEDSITKAYKGDTSTSSGKITLDSLLISADIFTNDTAYATKPYKGSKEVRYILGDALDDTAVADRKKVEASIKSGKTREEAVKEFTTEAYFETWFNALQKQVEDATK